MGWQASLTFRSMSVIGGGLLYCRRVFALAKDRTEARFQQTRDVVLDPLHRLFVCDRAIGRAIERSAARATFARRERDESEAAASGLEWGDNDSSSDCISALK